MKCASRLQSQITDENGEYFKDENGVDLNMDLAEYQCLLMECGVY